MPDFNQPAASEYFKPRDFEGELCAFEVLRYLPEYATPLTKAGEEGGTEANVTVLTGAKAGATYPEVVFNQVVLRAALRESVGGWVLARIQRGTAKPGQSAAFILGEFTAADKEIADHYFNTGETTATLPPEPPRPTYPPRAPRERSRPSGPSCGTRWPSSRRKVGGGYGG